MIEALVKYGCLPDGSLADRRPTRRQNWIECMICQNWGPPARDHDHKSGKQRGIICKACNLGLGFFRDDPDALTRAAEYLKFFFQEDLNAE